jgi:succinate dehydrogenase / fumarate reductase, cytochrome b subunit
MATRERPLSPFMIGPYYRPQLTSILSILHRASGVFLVAGALLLAAWLLAVSVDDPAYDRLAAALASLPGKLALMLLAAALVYHTLAGIRHLFWDAGKGYDIPTAYRSGYAVIVLTVVFTAALWWIGLGGRA